MIIFKIPVFNLTNGYHSVERTDISGALTVTSVTELVTVPSKQSGPCLSASKSHLNKIAGTPLIATLS